MTYIFLAWLNRKLCAWYGHDDFYEVNVPEGLITKQCVTCGHITMRVMEPAETAKLMDMLARMREEE